MPIDLYYVEGSGPCRSVIMTAKAVGVELNLIVTDLMKGEHMKPEFLKMNPQHVIPTINDDGFCLWESRSIAAYLVDQYAPDDKLYPKDAKKRALVNQRLYFDAGTLYQRFADLYYPMMFNHAPKDSAKVKKLEEALMFLDTFLKDQEYAAGSNLTIADLCLLSSISTIEVVGFPLDAYPNVLKWYNKIKVEAPGADLNQRGAEAFKKLYDNCMNH